VPRKLENWIQAYVKHSANSESPDSFHFWTAIATVAGALRRRVWRNELKFQWTPNFYIILVGPPGVVSKSTSIRGGFSLLERVPNIRFGPQSATWQALFEALTESEEAVDVDGETHIMSCLTCSVSELGTFLRTDDKEFVAQLIDMWDGQLSTFARRTRMDGEIKARNPWLNIVACTTPSWIVENCPPSMIEGGLFSRIMFVFGDKKRRLIAYPSREVLPDGYKKEEEELVHDLAQIAELKGPFELTEAAYKWGERWYEELHENRPAHLRGDRMGGYVARKQGHMHKLAMVLAASKRDALVLEVEDLEEADYYLTLVEKDMGRVFASIGQNNGSRASGELLRTIKEHKVVEYQMLWRTASLSMTLREFTETYKGLLETGYIKSEKSGDKFYITYVGEK
jgi:hypothetical protein